MASWAWLAPSYAVADGKKLWWVRGLACEMKSVASLDGQTLYVNGWGFPQNQPGRQVPTVPFDEGLKRYDKNGDGLVGKTEVVGDQPMDKMLGGDYGFPAFDLDCDEKLDAREWEVFRSMLGSENGLLAVTLGGEGHMTATAIKWRYQRPVPQVPSTLLYKGVLFMVNDSGILISFDPATGAVLKQGRLKGAIDKYFASPVGTMATSGSSARTARCRWCRRKGNGRSKPSTRSTTRSLRHRCLRMDGLRADAGDICTRSERPDSVNLPTIWDTRPPKSVRASGTIPIRFTFSSFGNCRAVAPESTICRAPHCS